MLRIKLVVLLMVLLGINFSVKMLKVKYSLRQLHTTNTVVGRKGIHHISNSLLLEASTAKICAVISNNVAREQSRDMLNTMEMFITLFLLQLA